MIQDVSFQRPEKVLILSVSTGEGHNSATRAVAEVLRQKNVECEVADSVEFKGKNAHGFIVKGYSWVIRNTPALFGLAYILGAAYDNMLLPSPIKSYHHSYAEKIYNYIKEKNLIALYARIYFLCIRQLRSKKNICLI